MDNYKIELTEDSSNKTKQLIFSGELSINYIHFIKDEVDELINPHDAYQIVVNNVDIIDLSFIQLIISIKNSNPGSIINMDLNEETTNLLNISGYRDITKNNSK